MNNAELAAVVRQAAEACKHAIETNPEVARAYRRAKAALERDKARLEVRSE